MSDSPASDSQSSAEGPRAGGGSGQNRRVPSVHRLKARVRLARRRMWPSETVSLGERLETIDSSFVEDGAQEISASDVERVVDEADAIEDRFRDNGPLRRLLDDGRLLIDLVRDTWEGRYQRVPWWTISGASFTLLYVLNPFDLVPDALPVIGMLDDATVVSACLVLLEQDLADYRQWLVKSNRSAPDEKPP